MLVFIAILLASMNLLLTIFVVILPVIAANYSFNVTPTMSNLDSFELTSEPLCGNSGCLYKIWVSNSKSKYHDSALLFFNPNAIYVETFHKNGFYIHTYNRSSSESGTYTKYTLINSALKKSKSFQFFPTGKDSIVYLKYFRQK